ncbi:MAG: Histidine-specific methyltransferase EgtD [Candidatus Accumulibacter phosphatis]|uniref:Histidine-specific methyltransferase EgtD n=2 Tax=Candidatus Accumulibacter TaxID=327159 RepID=A0A080M349_9PROT|nr:MAG: Histidine-specific methyltransferase EgtD [Candidatus Accumulibacter phosphatis]
MPMASVGLVAEIAAGLCAAQANVSPKYFYDAAGSALFERITRLPEYYLTRTEAKIIETHGEEMARQIGPGATVIELGAGNCEKARALCAMIRPRCFVAIDISADFLHQAVDGLRDAFPSLDVRPVVADLLGEIVLPGDVPSARRLVFYPGSSIGNFDPEVALALLGRMRGLLGNDGALLIGVDLVKDEAVLEAAYNDAAGVTAAFNLNVLQHLNRLLGADFDLTQWQHRAFFNRQKSRIEMHLEALHETRVAWPNGFRNFRRGEHIHTENSYKYRIDDFAGLLGRAGFSNSLRWTDPEQWFAIFLARP